MRTKLYILLLGIVTVLLTMGCERRELVEPSNTHYVRIYINEEIRNVSYGFYNDNYARPVYTPPAVLRVILTNPLNGEAMAERFLRDRGRDEHGTYYEGHIIAEPGLYSLMAYNFDTETTLVVGHTNHNHTKAYTNEIASHLYTRIPSRTATKADPNAPRERIVYEPDHLFAANCGGVSIPHTERIDTLRPLDGSERFVAESIVRSYYMQIQVEGMEFASSSVGLLTGMAGSSWVNGTGMLADDNVTLFFEMQPGESSAAGMKTTGSGQSTISTLYTTFHTFGKLLEAENELEITFDFITTYGEPYSEAINITHLFGTPEAINNQWLLIDHTIRIPEPPPSPGGGGLNPDVSEWDEENVNIKI